MSAASEPKVCLTIAGLDPSGGAGIVADIKTFSAFGCYAAAVVTSITFQNTTGVFGAVHQEPAKPKAPALTPFLKGLIGSLPGHSTACLHGLGWHAAAASQSLC